jgi:hypothetical protein
MTELNVRIASTREAPTAGDNAHTTYGRRKTTERALIPQAIRTYYLIMFY